jgi:hypothetical protein
MMPHRLNLRRRNDQLSLAALILALLSFVTVVVVAWSVIDLVSRGEDATCALVVYAERNAQIAREGDETVDPPRAPNPEAAVGLEQLAAEMRATGITCAPRPIRAVPSPSP